MLMMLCVSYEYVLAMLDPEKLSPSRSIINGPSGRS